MENPTPATEQPLETTDDTPSTEEPLAHARTHAEQWQETMGRRKARSRQRQQANAQAQAAAALARCAALGVPPLPLIPEGQRASVAHLSRYLLDANGGQKRLELVARLHDEAMDREAPRSLDAVRIVLDRAEGPVVQKHETASVSVRRVLMSSEAEAALHARTLDVTPGGQSEPALGPIQVPLPIPSTASAPGSFPASASTSSVGGVESRVTLESVMSRMDRLEQLMGRVLEGLERRVTS